MANSIALFKSYVAMLDEVYKLASLSSVLDGAAELAQQGANVNELIIPKISMDGLANYSRNGGYVAGDVTLTNETVKCNFDRGRMFSIDNLDNAETAGVAYGRLASEFIRTKVGTGCIQVCSVCPGHGHRDCGRRCAVYGCCSR